MALPNLLPPQEWVTSAEPGAGLMLREPTGQAYNPNGPPEWMAGEGLTHLYAAGDAVRLTIICSMQEAAADWGDPAALESLARTAQLFGVDVERAETEPDFAYAACYADTFLRQDVPCFDLVKGENEQDEALRAAIEDLAYERQVSMRLLAEAIPPEEHELYVERAVQLAANLLCVNAMDWSILDFAGQAHAREGLMGGHIVIDIPPLHIDIIRKARLLGLTIDTCLIDIDRWHEAHKAAAFSASAIMKRGTFGRAFVE